MPTPVCPRCNVRGTVPLDVVSPQTTGVGREQRPQLESATPDGPLLTPSPAPPSARDRPTPGDRIAERIGRLSSASSDACADPKHHRLASTRTPGSRQAGRRTRRPAWPALGRRGIASRSANGIRGRRSADAAEPRRRVARRRRLGPDRAVAAAVVGGAPRRVGPERSPPAGPSAADRWHRPATDPRRGSRSGATSRSQDRGVGRWHRRRPVRAARDRPRRRLGDFAAIDVGDDQVEPEVPVDGRGPVHRRRHAGQADRGRHDRPRRQRPGQDLQGQARRHARRRSPRSSTSRR